MQRLLRNVALLLLLISACALNTPVSAQQYTRNDVYAKRAWEKLKTDVGINSVKELRNKQFIYHQYPTIHKSEISQLVDSGKTYKFTDLADGIELLIRADKMTQQTRAYNTDLVALTHQSLANLGYTVYTRMMDAYSKNNVRKFEKHAADFVEIAIDMDVLTGSKLRYSHLPRWKAFIELAKESLLQHKPINKEELLQWNNAFEKSKSTAQSVKLKTIHKPNTTKTAILLFEKYKFHLISNFYKQPDVVVVAKEEPLLKIEKLDVKSRTKFVGNISNDRPDDTFKDVWNQITPENTTKWVEIQVSYLAVGSTISTMDRFSQN